MFVKLIIGVFALFALSRVWLRFRDGSMGLLGLSLWGGMWVALGVTVWVPAVTAFIAHIVGIGRGADLLIYISVIGLLYGVFRLYIKLEFIEHELTALTRKLALRERQREEK